MAKLDGRLAIYAFFSNFMLYGMAVEPLNPGDKNLEGYDPQPWFWQWKRNAEQWGASWKYVGLGWGGK